VRGKRRASGRIRRICDVVHFTSERPPFIEVLVILRSSVFRRTLWLEAAGFLLIAAIIWMDELLDLPRLFFGAAPTPVRMGEGWMESGLTLLVGTAIVSITYRAFRRIEYLESLVVMCAWCRRVRGDDGWLTVEAFLQRQHHAHTTHGICEGCAAEIRVPPGSLSPRSGMRLSI
jgi:uncharacterized membrane protein